MEPTGFKFAQAAERFAFGSADVIVAGGVESMTMIPMTGLKLSASPEAMERVPEVYTPMGITAEIVASRFNVTREAQDAFAARSHQRAAAAQKEGTFSEIVPVEATRYEVKDGKTVRAHATFDRDEMVILGIHRPETPKEHDVAEVRRKAAEAGLKYPIAVDNENHNWNAWANGVWPSVYLIDKSGFVRYWWCGELNWQGAKGDQWMRSRIAELLAARD